MANQTAMQAAPQRRPDTDAAASAQPGAPLYAALDLGTNSCRMLIARPKGSHFQIVDSFSKSVQFGNGLEGSRALSRQGMSRATAALRICARKIEALGVTRARLVATEACRRAVNTAAFLGRIRSEVGLTLEVIAPEEEAYLAVMACAPLLKAATEQVLIVDIGGGSTELVWLDLSRIAPADRRRALLALRRGLAKGDCPRDVARVVDWISVPQGVATLRDQFADVEDDTARFALMACHFEEAMAEFAPYREAPTTGAGFQIIGTSGTVTTVAASHLQLKRYDRAQVDGLSMTNAQVLAVIRSYLDLGAEGRLADPRIGRDRHELIMSGAAILQTLLRLWPTEALTVADRGLREGLLYSQMFADGLLDPGAD